MNPYFFIIVAVLVVLSVCVARSARNVREAMIYTTCCGVLLGGVAGFLFGHASTEEAATGSAISAAAIDMTWKAALFGGVASLLTAALCWSNKKNQTPVEQANLSGTSRPVPASRSRVVRRIKELLKQDHVVNPQLFAYLDLDQVVARRQQPDYQREWQRALADIGARKDETLLAEHDIDMVNRIRGSAYKKTLQITDHLPLSDRVGEELGLIALAVLIDYRDGWVGAIGQAYFEGRLPEAPLTPVAGDLADLVPEVEGPGVASTTETA